MSDSLDDKMAELRSKVLASRRDLEDLRRRVRGPVRRWRVAPDHDIANDPEMGRRRKAA